MRPFEIAEPRALREAVSLLDAQDPSVRAIAGGTALMLMMKSGVFQPTRLVSLRGVEAEHARIDVAPDGALRIGAMASLAALERATELARYFPVIPRTLRTLSNIRVRNVACLGGHLAHGDPHMDLPPVLAALGARIVVIGPKGERTMPVEDLVKGYYETALAGNELIAAVMVPKPERPRAVYVKVTTRSADDWPTLGIAVALDAEGARIRSARIAVSAATERVIRLTGAEQALSDVTADAGALARAGDAALAEVETVPDARGSAAYKRELVRVHLGRAIRQALSGGEGR